MAPDSRASSDWPYVTKPDWGPYHSRLAELLKVSGKKEVVLVEGPVIYTTYNWYPYYAKDRQRIAHETFQATSGVELDAAPCHTDPDTGEIILRLAQPTLPSDVAAFVTLRIPVSQLDERSLPAVIEATKVRLADAMKNRPTADEAPNMALVRPIPPQREFLLRRRDEVFTKDLERFKLYMQGLTFRQIAAIEYKATKGKVISSASVARVGKEMPTERSVSESIHLIYEAIYLRPLPETNPWSGSLPRQKTPSMRAEEPVTPGDALTDAESFKASRHGVPGTFSRRTGSRSFRQVTGLDSGEEQESSEVPRGDRVQAMHRAMARLDSVESAVLVYGASLSGDKAKIHDAVARRFGLSADRVRVVEAAAQQKIRQYLQEVPPSKPENAT